jgi:hypothetical protein
VSASGYAVALILLEGPVLDELIERRWQMLPLANRELPEWAPTRAVWLMILQNEWEAELGQFCGPYHGRFNLVGRRAYWQMRDVNTVLREHGYLS